MTDLNATLTEALARGERPFRCWACHGWFTDTGKPGRGRPRIVCEAQACIAARRVYAAYGTMPGEKHATTVGQTQASTMTRAVLRAVEADWLTDIEIAEELGCCPSYVSKLRNRAGRKPVPHKRGAA